MIKDKKEISKELDVCIDDLNKVLEEIRHYIKMDGGDVLVVGIKGKEVHVRLLGACHGCPNATMTLQYGVESLLQEKVHSEIVVIQAE